MSDSNSSPGKTGRGRRRRGRRREGRGFAALLPHLLTTANLAAGFYAIVKAGEGEFERAAVALIVAGVFDVLDGRAARFGHTSSRFGLEFDSIADTVSFGVAPAILAFNAGAFYELGWTGWVMAFIFMACAALRLARFNVSPGRYPGHFEGLPSPAAAGIVITTVLLSGWLRESGLSFGVPATLVALGVALVGLLMVSPIPYRSFKHVSLRGSYWNVVLMVMATTVIQMRPEFTLFVIAYAYAVSGPAEVLWRRRVGRPLVEAAVRDGSEGEQAEALDHD